MQRICVYCASNPGVRDIYADAARNLGQVLVDEGYELVYGGSAKGVMGILADAVLQRGGAVHGVIPEEELVEILTWGQLHIHTKPVGIINVDGYFDGLVAFLDHAVAEGFLPAASREMLHSADDATALIEDFKTYQPPTSDKWM
jgi:predicted Rossmann-fold nucleotide-binding protein